jgi:hypothetical protein
LLVLILACSYETVPTRHNAVARLPQSLLSLSCRYVGHLRARPFHPPVKKSRASHTAHPFHPPFGLIMLRLNVHLDQPRDYALFRLIFVGE